MVRAFSVTSSPTRPSPRVRACSKRPSLIVRGHGEAIELQLGDILVRSPLQQAVARAHRIPAVPPRSERCPGSAWGTVRNFDESFAGLAAYALGGRIRRAEFRVRIFQLSQFTHEPIVFGVGDLGLVEHVIEIFVMLELLTQPLPRAS